VVVWVESEGTGDVEYLAVIFGEGMVVVECSSSSSSNSSFHTSRPSQHFIKFRLTHVTVPYTYVYIERNSDVFLYVALRNYIPFYP